MSNGNGTFTYLSSGDNNVTNATVTASTASSTYPVSNVKILPISKHWRSTGVTSENLQFDLGSAKAINLISIVNHNLTSAATITINGGSSSNPNGSQYTTTMTWRQFDAFKLLTSNQTWQYWKIIFADVSNTDSYIRVGYVMLGTSTTFTFHWQYGSEFTDQFVNIQRRAGGGTPYVEAVYSHIRQKFIFGPLSQTDMATFRTFYRALSGSAVPFFCIPEALVYDGYFGRWIEDLVRRLDFHESATVTFEEDPRGKVVSA